MIYNLEHLTKETFFAFHEEALSEEEYLKVLEHISNCDLCAELFANSFTSTNTLSMPHYLKDNIMEEISHSKETEFRTKNSLKQKSLIQKQLFFYSIKVCAAMAGALFLTFSGLFQSDFSGVPMNFPLFHMSKISDFNKSLNEFSTKLINLEVNYNDQEKK